MRSYQEDFTAHLVRSGALIFEPRKLKSGRLSPYYVSMRKAVDTGRKAAYTAKAYVEEIITTVGMDFDYIHGPAYAGIPLASLTAVQLWNLCHVDKRWGYDRREEKKYGDKAEGLIVGDLRDGDVVLMEDDVVTTGRTKIENWRRLSLVRRNLKPKGILIAVDREEVDEYGEPTALLLEKSGFQLYPILRITEVVDWLHDKEIDGKIVVTDSIYDAFQNYFAKYGVRK